MTIPPPAACRRGLTRVLYSLVTSLATAGASAQSAPEPSWAFHVRMDRHSDPLPLSDFEDEELARVRPRGRQNLLYVEDEARLSRRDGDWTWSLLGRSSATLVLNRDAVEVIGHVANKTTGGGDQAWQTKARLRGFSGAGLELQRHLSLDSRWSLGVSAQALRLTRWLERRIDGPVQFEAAQSLYSFDLRSTEVNDHLRFPFQRDFPSHGLGLLFGTELQWQGERLGVGLALRDAGWLRWDDIPRQDAVLSTNVQGRDADGFLIYRPLVQGQNSQARRTVRWPVRVSLHGAWQLDARTTLRASADRLPDYDRLLPAVAMRRRWSEVEAGLGWRFHERRATATLAWKGWQLELGADRLGGDAHSRRVGLAYATAL